MVRFFLKLFLFCAVVGAPYLYLQQELMAKNDAFYWKSTHKANSLIIGGSRALKGIVPSLLKEELGLKEDVLNFAFTAVLSPYGKPYYELIKRKVDCDNTGSHLFILSVNPGNIMDFSGAKAPRESSFGFYKLKIVNINPNYEYVFRHPRDGQSLFASIVKDKANNREGRKISHDGYAATFLKSGGFESKQKNGKKLLKYDLISSPEREHYLIQTITYLSALGPVYLVRMPVSQQMKDEEDLCYSNFNDKMQKIANNFNNVHFINYATSDTTGYKFSDGNHHLEGKSAIKFTKSLANYIKQKP